MPKKTSGESIEGIHIIGYMLAQLYKGVTQLALQNIYNRHRSASEVPIRPHGCVLGTGGGVLRR